MKINTEKTLFNKRFKPTLLASISVAAMTLLPSLSATAATKANLIHDAEQNILQEQFGEKWAKQDVGLQKKLDALYKKHGKRPNIIHIMWDDTSFGEVGIKAFNKIRGFDTPNINKMGEEGIVFTRMYSEPSCTPTRAAALTGRLAVRSGMHTVSFPPEGGGLPAEEVTIAEVLSEAGYSTSFVGKGHMGDIEESYLHNQGFDEAQFSMYNQFPPAMWHATGQAANATIGLLPDMHEKKYLVDATWRPDGYIMDIQGKKGGLARETLSAGYDVALGNYRKLIEMHQENALGFIKRKAKDDKPFYLAYWPNVYDLMRDGQEITTSNSTPFAQNMERLDRHVGEILAELKKQGISENTIVVAMADNGPMEELAGAMYQNVFNGGKGSYKEGGIRVTAFAQWPGMIEKGQYVGDMITVHDLFTTFARIGDAMEYIPTDRVIDGIDQTAVFLAGDGNSRRDYYHVYTGTTHAATIKQQYKRVWVGDRPGLVKNNFFDLYQDPREMRGMMAQFLWAWGPFDMMKHRHENMNAKYPFTPTRHGIPFEGITNLRPESKVFQETVRKSFAKVE
ncbi:sulfatase-like hydrolase/transferase [Colwellia piezophila]|uniref:sulfatase-like hydrolase/transferase n=1 Tax=Colwellia piezophila TaxID=211668 RepID=UPI00037D7977|nr:sulfatase-like hydrolase/transferase [Colwellia piezophila]